MTAIADPPAAGRGRRGRAGLVVGLVVAGVVLLVLIGLAAPARRNDGPALDPTSTSPNGTKAVVELARQLGADVTVGANVPGAGTDVALMFEDLGGDGAADRLLAWVREGHTLVVAAPTSQLAPEADYVRPDDPFSDSQRVARDRCDVDEPAGFERLSDLESFGPVARFQVPEGARSCFADADGAVVVVQRSGRGTLVSVGTPWVFTNEALDQADNAGLFAVLAVPERGTRLQVLVAGSDPAELAPPDDGGSLDLPTGVGLALLQLLVAFVVYCLYRARRLGRPVPEDPPVVIAGSELVRAVGGLLEHAGARDRAAASLRRAACRRLADHFGLPPAASVPAVVDVVAARSTVERERLAAALHAAPVADDAALGALGRELDELVDAALGRPSAHPTRPGGRP